MNKKNGHGNFDVTMESRDEAEVCELVGLCMLNELSKIFDKGIIDLYRDALREWVPFVQFKKREKFAILLKVSSEGPTLLHIRFCGLSKNSK